MRRTAIVRSGVSLFYQRASRMLLLLALRLSLNDESSLDLSCRHSGPCAVHLSAVQRKSTGRHFCGPLDALTLDSGQPCPYGGSYTLVKLLFEYFGLFVFAFVLFVGTLILGPRVTVMPVSSPGEMVGLTLALIVIAGGFSWYYLGSTHQGRPSGTAEPWERT